MQIVKNLGITILVLLMASAISACSGSRRLVSGTKSSGVNNQATNTVQEPLTCSIFIENAQAIPVVSSATTSPAFATVSAYPSSVRAFVYLLQFGTNQSSNTLNSQQVGARIQLSLPNPVNGSGNSGFVKATVQDETGAFATCESNYQMVQTGPQPGNPNALLFNGGGQGIAGWDASSGYWFKNQGGSFIAFGKWPVGIAYDRIGFGDFNGDSKLDVIGRDPVTQRFYVALDGNAPDTTLVGFTAIEAGQPIPMFSTAIRDTNADGKSDYVFTDANGIERVYTAALSNIGQFSFTGPTSAPMRVTVSVSPANPVPHNTRVTIAWTSANATSCELKNAAGAVVRDAAGAEVRGTNRSYVTPVVTANTNFSVVCNNPYQPAVTEAASIIVDAPPAVALAVSREVAGPGEVIAVTVSYSGVVATSCSFSANSVPLPLPANGVANLPVNPPTTIALACLTPAGAMLTATKVITPPLVVRPNPDVANVDFGNQQEGSTSAARHIKFKNMHATAAAQMGVVSISGGPFSIVSTNCSGALAGNTECNVSLKFSPPGRARYEGNLVINYHNGIQNVSLVMPLVGTGIKKSGK